MTWQEDAKKLAFGQRRKVEHCGPDRTMYINNSEAGVGMFCFRCKEKDFEAHGKLSAADYLRMRKADDDAVIRGVPETTGFDTAPNAAALFTLRAGLAPEHVTRKYGFGWDDRTKRVIIPVLHNLKRTGQWMGRAVDGRKPKYLFGRGSTSAHWIAIRQGRPLVVVEDVLSAIKTYEAGYSSIAVCGTSIARTAAMAMIGHEVVGWFDADKAGDEGYIKLRKAVAPFGINPRKVRSNRDPKLHTRDEIRRVINGG